METATSYLITSYNKQAFLPAVLASVAAEADRTGGEILLIDDGSSDGSPEICTFFAASRADVRYVQTENKGVYAALNTILPLARAPWARTVDSDDPLIAGSTLGMIETARRTGAGFVFGESISYGPGPPDTAVLAATPYTPGTEKLVPDALRYLVLGMNFTSTCALYSRTALAATQPLPPGFLSCQDFAMALRAATVVGFARTTAKVCFYLRGVPNQLIASEALTQHQTVALAREFWHNLPRPLQQKAAAKFALRARRWRNHHKGESFLDATGSLLLARALLAKSRLSFGAGALRQIEAVYEPEIADILKRLKTAY